jgi:hypothetical protein
LRTIASFSVLSALLLAAACGGGKKDVPRDPGTGGTGPTTVPYDEARALDSCQSGCAAYAAACTEDCSAGCDDSTRLSSAEDCPGEFYDYYDCVAAAPADAFDCAAGDAVTDNPVASCAASWTAYTQCRRTRGYPCALVMRDASVCPDPATPDWGTCKVDVEPPDGCVPLDATDYCCPPE